MDYTIGDWTKLGATVRQQRIADGLTQSGLADRAHVSRAWLARFEAGHRKAELEQVFRVLGALDLTLALREKRHTPGEAAILAALDVIGRLDAADEKRP